MRSACRAQITPAQRTHALPPKFASRLSGSGLLPPRQAWVPFRKTSPLALGVGRAGTPSGQACTAPSGKSLNKGATKMYNRTLLIGRIGHDAEAKTDKNQQEYVVLSIATKDSWKNDQGDYESRTE